MLFQMTPKSARGALAVLSFGCFWADRLKFQEKIFGFLWVSLGFVDFLLVFGFAVSVLLFLSLRLECVDGIAVVVG